MRISVVLRNVFPLLALASSALVYAQFHQPTDEELKMTADPKAPGAAAVYLNIEEVTDDQQHTRSYYQRIKVLEEKGKALATVEILYGHEYFKITDVKGRTIHSDGTVIPLTVKPEDLLAVKAGDRQVDRKVFTLPSVEVGSILEFHYLLTLDDNHYSSPDWEIQRPYFVHKAHYGFTPFKAFLPGTKNATNNNRHYLLDASGQPVNSLVWWPILPPGAAIQTDSIGRMSLDLSDIPAVPHEEWMPPIRNTVYKVIFYYEGSSDAGQFWIDSSKRWSKEVDHFAEPSGPIKGAVAGLIAPGDSDLVKAKKLYKAVQALDNTDYTRRKGESELKELKLKDAKRAEDTWAQKSGSSEDIALLYLAMVRAAGLTAYAMKVVDRDEGSFDPTYLNMGQLNTTLVLLSIDGKTIPVDPGEKMCPFQTLNWRHSNAHGIRQAPTGPAISNTPGQDFAANTILRSGNINLDAQGAVTGDFQFVMTGQEALYWRQMALENDLDEVKKRFDATLQSSVPVGIEVHLNQFQGLDDPDANLVAVVPVKGSLGTATSKRLLLPGFFFETRSRQPFIDQEKRLEPVDMHYAEKVTDQVVYHLPAGFAVEGAPPDAKDLWAGHGEYIVKTVPQPGTITIYRVLAQVFTQVKAEEYQDLRGFYQKIAASDQQQLVLAASAAPKGE